MGKEERKQVGFNADVEHDKIISVRAEQQGKSKSDFYREVVEEYFLKYPLSDAEKSLIK